MAWPLRGGGGLRAWPLRIKALKKILTNIVATKLEGEGGKAFVAGPLQKRPFLRLLLFMY